MDCLSAADGKMPELIALLMEDGPTTDQSALAHVSKEASWV